uniref:Translation elongation factor EFTs/EF1B dimerisation domain-containing protein n=1 Tax=Gallus gallus TaxID=9031 RepID=A0A8V1A944_CHICK
MTPNPLCVPITPNPLSVPMALCPHHPNLWQCPLCVPITPNPLSVPFVSPTPQTLSVSPLCPHGSVSPSPQSLAVSPLCPHHPKPPQCPLCVPMTPNPLCVPITPNPLNVPMALCPHHPKLSVSSLCPYDPKPAQCPHGAVSPHHPKAVSPLFPVALCPHPPNLRACPHICGVPTSVSPHLCPRDPQQSPPYPHITMSCPPPPPPGSMGENMALRRAAFLAVPPDCFIASYAHGPPPGEPPPPHTAPALGRYGALVACRVTEPGVSPDPAAVGRKVAQHVVGMAPLSVGGPGGDVGGGRGGRKEGGEEEEEEGEGEEEETRLLAQSFVLQPSLTVAEFVRSHGVAVLDFVRFQCGEEERG